MEGVAFSFYYFFFILDNEYGLYKLEILSIIEVDSDIHRPMLFGGLGRMLCVRVL